jgi:hypothetical protein
MMPSVGDTRKCSVAEVRNTSRSALLARWFVKTAVDASVLVDASGVQQKGRFGLRNWANPAQNATK